ncbi:hypothetical protein VMCG_03065 [Cytospora schulzeri]|uniref:Alcohol acetyltransferase FCK4 n=1 Tax=Cytospora schulzeri TaxID=448051 RepID=A0A423WYA7_9PEZI|nr:hypothetical protein VMCG_03065 [Valsa malicola]
MLRLKQTCKTGRADSKLLRKLGNNEVYQLAMYLLDQYRGTSVSGRYSIPARLSGSGSESKNRLVRAVETAIVDTVLKHPVLQVAIADSQSRSPKWVQLETLDLRRHVTWHFKDSELGASLDNVLQELLANEVDATYPELDSRPGWRIVVIHFQATNIVEIVFTWNHPHCDGTSGKIFHADLLRSLNSVGKDAEIDTDDRSMIKLPDSAPILPPPIEEICKLPLTIPFVLKTMWKEWGPTTFRPALARWAPIADRASPFKTQVRSFTIEAEPLRNILFACRQHKTTLTGLLHVLTLASLASQLAEEAAPAFASGTTIDMRRYIEPNLPAYPWFEAERTMANFVTLMDHEFDRGLVSQIRSLLSRPAIALNSPTEVERMDKAVALSSELADLIWSTAARVRREIEDRIDAGLKNDMVGMMKFVGDWQQEMANASRRPRQHSWWVTGIGVLDGALSKSGSSSDNATSPPAAPGDNEAWAIRRAQFALSTETTAAAISISPLTVAGERLCVGGSWQDCLFDVSLGERIMADLEAWLGQLA